ncbi:hypothetical protein AVEN_132703-1 [Araneus ventricosus]|uniref:Uncharacterized protein n=1 Tax=Araneus ventricosus TaxID=182803 RepID=A0A4Y2AXM1_ARAVE|nr:hypothetical protein AVEN_132703-1 [Araneus ventricosus]
MKLDVSTFHELPQALLFRYGLVAKFQLMRVVLETDVSCAIPPDIRCVRGPAARSIHRCKVVLLLWCGSLERTGYHLISVQNDEILSKIASKS